MLKRELNNRGQLTLFVIFGILIVVGIITLFMLLPDPEIVRTSSAKDPLQDIRPCIQKSLSDVLPEYFRKGMYSAPIRTVKYSGENIAYHCYTSKKREICLRNDAQDKSRIEEELKEMILPGINKCFFEFSEDSKGYEVTFGEANVSLEVLPGKININVRNDVKVTKAGEEPSVYSNFDTSINSPLFDFLRISNEILNEEVSCNCPRDSCTADTTKLMKDNRDYKISFYTGGSSDRVYSIGDYQGDYLFRFGVKNCDRTP